MILDSKTRKELAMKVHANSVRHGFWIEHHDPQHFLTLVCCELAEAVEADRKDSRADLERMRKELANPDPHEAARPEEQYHYWFQEYVKDTVEDELADAYIRCLDMVDAYNIDVEGWGDRLPGIAYMRSRIFTEAVYLFMRVATSSLLSLDFKLRRLMGGLETLADDLGIDLLAHIEAKMRYNESRSYKHGKAY